MTLNLLARYRKRKRFHTLVQAITVWIVTLLILAFYPESLILQTPGHLLTIVIGGCLLFATLAALIRAWLPQTPPRLNFVRVRRSRLRRLAPTIVVAAVGMFVGVAAYLSESSEGGTLPAVRQIVFVSSVYVGLGAAGLLIGYALLGELLGFAVKESQGL